MLLRSAAFAVGLCLVLFDAAWASASSSNGFPADRIDQCANVAANRAFVGKHRTDAGEAADFAAELDECSWSLRDNSKQCSLWLESGDQYRVAAALLKEDDPSDIVHYRVWTAGAYESYLLADGVCEGSRKKRASDGFVWALRVLGRP
jgi:hypothetical protein